MSPYFYVTMMVCGLSVTPFVIRLLWAQIRWEEYCLEQRKSRDRKAAAAEKVD